MKTFTPEKPLSELSAEELTDLASSFADDFASDFKKYKEIGKAVTTRDPFITSVIHFAVNVGDPHSPEIVEPIMAFVGYYEKQFAELETRVNNLAALIAEKD